MADPNQTPDQPHAPPQGVGAASSVLTAILTTAQTLVQALNGVSQNYLNVQGQVNTPQIKTSLLLKSTPGRVALVIVNVAATGAPFGWIYDTNLLTSTSNRVYAIPQAVGVYLVNIPMRNGIVIQPGDGQELTVTWS